VKAMRRLRAIIVSLLVVCCALPVLAQGGQTQLSPLMARERAYYEGVFKQRVENGWDRFTVSWRIGEHPEILVVVPHGKRIEHNTRAIGDRIARRLGASLYVFEADAGRDDLKVRPAWTEGGHPLHITATLLRAPQLGDMLRAATVCIAVHGIAEKTERTEVGGCDRALREAAIRELQAAGFAANTAAGRVAGVSPANFVNRSAGGRGLQLEIGLDLRKTGNQAAWDRYAEAVAAAIRRSYP